MTDAERAAREAAALCDGVVLRSEPRLPVGAITPQTGAVQVAQLRKRVLQRIDDTISGVRALAEVVEPTEALRLLRVLGELQAHRTLVENGRSEWRAR